MAFFASLKQIAGNESTSIAKDLMTEFAKLVDGTLSLPINLPGTNYHRGFQVILHHLKILSQIFIYMFLNFISKYGWKKKHWVVQCSSLSYCKWFNKVKILYYFRINIIILFAKVI